MISSILFQIILVTLHKDFVSSVCINPTFGTQASENIVQPSPIGGILIQQVPENASSIDGTSNQQTPETSAINGTSSQQTPAFDGTSSQQAPNNATSIDGTSNQQVSENASSVDGTSNQQTPETSAINGTFSQQTPAFDGTSNQQTPEASAIDGSASQSSIQSGTGEIIQKSREELSSLTRPMTPAEELTPLTSIQEWKQDCLDSHNFFRNKYIDNLTGQTLGLLQWDEKLAQSAQQWADKVAPKLLNRDLGPIDHSESAYGENMFATSYEWKHDFTCSPGILSYHKEVGIYNLNLEKWRANATVFNPNGRFSYGDASHFTQLMWPNTTTVGCGFAYTIDETIEDEKKKKKKKVEICHYYDSGNKISDKLLVDLTPVSGFQV